jgi:hypothetical protein
MVDDILKRMVDDGYAIIPGAIGPDQVMWARSELESIVENTPKGRDDFEGHRTRRVYGLFAKTRSLDALAVHDIVLGVLDGVLGHYQLSAPTGISIGPGESAQPLHPDDAIYPVPPSPSRARGQRHVAPPGLHGRQRRHPHRPRESSMDRRASRPGHRDHHRRDPGGNGPHLYGQCLARGRGESKWQQPPRGRSPLRRVLVAAGREPRSGRAPGGGLGPSRAVAGASRLQHPSAVHRVRRRSTPAEVDRRSRRIRLGVTDFWMRQAVSPG